ncbi:MAG TPA: bifunctional precorrin-2 dehydrogenase/sirohydrochlorin ferrochelatase [Acidimicrobiales bacterium]|jgi:precorrin-2 dehydrogenase|nr:bifunctional precorrin-2 dehydrogenase/sirohydrochlorin ferrochelatase [Acidimicrobiales bacterium]
MALPDALYPVNLVLEGRRCVVVGGGTVAARKVEGLVAAGADVVVIAPSVDESIRSRRDVSVIERRYRKGDLDGAWLAIAATDDRAVNRQVHDDGEAARVWVNAADDPPSCSFTLPAVVRRGPVQVAVSTAGHSPALAAWIRGQIADLLGPEVALLAEWLSEAREEMKASGRSTEDVDWRTALDSDMLELIRSGQVALARERLQACLSSQ